MAQIEIISPDKQRSSIELKADSYIIGRDPSAPIQLQDKKVSRHHAKISFKEGTYWIEDLGSANGVLVNGALINAPTKLAENMDIEVGNFHLRYIADAANHAPFQLKGLNRIVARKVFELPFGETTIGRVDGNTLVVVDKSVSRFHTKITVSDSGITVEDLGSSNGTFIDREQIDKPAQITPGQRLRIGSVEFILEPYGGIKRASIKELILATDRQYLVAVAIALMALFMLVLVTVIAVSGASNKPKLQYSVMDQIEREISNTINQGTRQQAEGQWDIAIDTFRKVLAQDPLNIEADKRLRACQNELTYSQNLSEAQQVFRQNDAQKAQELLLSIPNTSHYYESARRFLMDVNGKLSEQYYEEAIQLTRRNKKDYLAIHDTLIKHLTLNPASQKGRRLVTEVEKQLVKAQIDFVSYEEQLENIAGRSQKLITQETVEKLKARYSQVLAPIMVGYIDGSLEDTKNVLNTVTGSDSDEAAKIAKRLNDIQQKMAMGNGAKVDNNSQRAIEAWESAIKTEGELLPEGVESRTIKNLKNMVAKEYFTLGDQLFKKQIFTEAFDNWYKGHQLDRSNTDIATGFNRLDAVAKRKFAEAQRMAQSNPSAACEAFRTVLNITMPESQWHQGAQEQLNNCR